MVHAVSFALKKAETSLEKLQAVVLAGCIREGASGRPACCLPEAEKVSEDNTRRPRRPLEEFDRSQRSKSLKGKDLLGHLGLLFFPLPFE